MAKKRKLTDEQKKKKREREKERYRKARKAGFTPEQARSIQKTIKNNPEILQEPTEEVLDLLGTIQGFSDQLEQFAGELLEPKKKKRGRTSGKKQGGGRKPRKKPKDVVKRERSFRQFVQRHPDLSANELIRLYRAQGKSIGNEKGKDIIREVRGTPKDKRKITRIKYYSNFDNPVKKHFIKDKYMYLVRYEVEREDQADTYEDYLHIPSPVKLNMREIREATLQAFEDGQDAGDEKYKAVRIIEESIELIYAVDTTMSK